MKKIVLLVTFFAVISAPKADAFYRPKAPVIPGGYQKVCPVPARYTAPQVARPAVQRPFISPAQRRQLSTWGWFWQKWGSSPAQSKETIAQPEPSMPVSPVVTIPQLAPKVAPMPGQEAVSLGSGGHPYHVRL